MIKKDIPVKQKVISLSAVVAVFATAFTLFSISPSYRDLNKNGKMDVYEDKTQPIEASLIILM